MFTLGPETGFKVPRGAVSARPPTSRVRGAHGAAQAHILEHQVGVSILLRLHHTSQGPKVACFKPFQSISEPFWTFQGAPVVVHDVPEPPRHPVCFSHLLTQALGHPAARRTCTCRSLWHHHRPHQTARAPSSSACCSPQRGLDTPKRGGGPGPERRWRSWSRTGCGRTRPTPKPRRLGVKTSGCHEMPHLVQVHVDADGRHVLPKPGHSSTSTLSVGPGSSLSFVSRRVVSCFVSPPSGPRSFPAPFQ